LWLSNNDPVPREGRGVYAMIGGKRGPPRARVGTDVRGGDDDLITQQGREGGKISHKRGGGKGPGQLDYFGENNRKAESFPRFRKRWK